MMKQSLRLYLFVFIAVGFSSIFILHHSGSQEQSTEDSLINSYILNAQFTEYNPDGSLKIKMTSDKITHWENTGETLFTKPYLITFTEVNHDPWHIHADEGVSNKAGDQLVLKNNVVIHELKTKQQPEVTITTTELTLFPKTSRATTDKAVTLTRPGSVIHGVGFSANLKTGEYQLRSQSDATVDPQQFKKRDRGKEVSGTRDQGSVAASY
ncbi:MAG TPA: LPS export ABC transporter periplasmic protein LptC [Coxiellaceae bacterium]|nr:LPS export ABC transporter periplasmic protein LptC [Coxiellaceae bacterium]